jgi:hypothetical protein
MLCTDAAARGIDLPGVHHVVQMDFASSAIDFLHRVRGIASGGGAVGVGLWGWVGKMGLSLLGCVCISSTCGWEGGGEGTEGAEMLWEACDVSK